MAHRRSIVTLILVCLVLLAAASAGAATRISSTAAQYFIALPMVTRNFRVLPPGAFFDDFSDPSSEWPVVDNPEYLTRYLNGEYQVLVKEGPAGGAKHPVLRVENYVVEVDARYASSIYGAYGISFAVTESDEDAYMFIVWEEGYYAIVEISRGSVVEPYLMPETASPHIKRGQSTNHLRIIRNGEEIKAYINGHHVVTVSDDTLTGVALGIGLVVGEEEVSEIANVDVRFDNFLTYPLTSSGGSVTAQ